MSASTSSTPGTITIGGELTVGRIGFGAMRLTGDQVWGEYPDHDGGMALLRHVVDSGVTFIDTADVYGPHANEELIREALHPYPDELVIATKGGFVRGGHDYSTLGAVGNPNYLRQSVHMSLRRLGLERIDLYYLHSGTATGPPFPEQVGVLAEMQAQGLIRHIGLSNVTVAQFEAAREMVEIAALTAAYGSAPGSGPRTSPRPSGPGSCSRRGGRPASTVPMRRASARWSAGSPAATARAPSKWRSPGSCSARRTACPSRGRPRSATSRPTSPPGGCVSPRRKSNSSPTSPPRSDPPRREERSCSRESAPSSPAEARASAAPARWRSRPRAASSPSRDAPNNARRDRAADL